MTPAPQPGYVALCGLVYLAMRRMDDWMGEVVRGHQRFDLEELRSCAVLLSHCLVGGSCPCGLPSCCRRHNIAARDPAEIGLPLFVDQAVIGPTGLQANSVAQGMFYRLILRVECCMLVDRVELNRCAQTRCSVGLYETARCPGGGCPSVYTPEETEVVDQDRLFIQGVYLPVRRWKCKTNHYFRQRLCRDSMGIVHEDDPEEPGEVVRYRVVHDPSGKHDYCPWCHCPHTNPRHPQRGTTLWVRQELAGSRPENLWNPPDANEPLLRLAAFTEGVRDWWRALDEATQNGLKAAFSREHSSSSEPSDDPLMIADWLLTGQPGEVIAAQVQTLREALARSFQALGLDQ